MQTRCGGRDEDGSHILGGVGSVDRCTPRGVGRVTGDPPRWNFHEYLLDHKGRMMGSFPSQVAPDDPRLVTAIERLL